MAKRKGNRKPSAAKATANPDANAVDRALDLIQALPPAEVTYNLGERAARATFEEGLKPLLDHLDTLCERHLPEASVPSPCGQSRFGNGLFRPWSNLLGCHDACGRCREQALRALRLLREGIVDGKPCEKFIEPEVAAALIERATRATEWERRFNERSKERISAQFSAVAQRAAARKKNPHPPGMNDLERAVLLILVRARPGHVVIGKDILKALDEAGSRERLSQGNLTSRMIPALEKKGVPIENAHPGYWIDWNKAPAWLEAMRSNGDAMTGQT